MNTTYEKMSANKKGYTCHLKVILEVWPFHYLYEARYHLQYQLEIYEKRAKL